MKYATLFGLIFISIKVESQIIIRNASLVVKDTNILIHHVQNRILVTGTTVKVSLISKNGNVISAYDSNEFTIEVRTFSPDTLLVYAGKQLLLKRIFFIDSLPEPSIQFGNIYKDTATVAEILANKGLRITTSGSLYFFEATIASFETTFIGPDSVTLSPPIKTSGNLLSKDQEEIIKSLTRNSKIVFDAIIVMTANNKTRRWSPFTIVVK